MQIHKKLKKKEYKLNTKESHQITRGKNKERNRELQKKKKKQKPNNKMPISTLCPKYFKYKWAKCSNQKI